MEFLYYILHLRTSGEMAMKYNKFCTAFLNICIWIPLGGASTFQPTVTNIHKFFIPSLFSHLCYCLVSEMGILKEYNHNA